MEFDKSKMPVFDADNDDFSLTLYNLNCNAGYASQTDVTQNVAQDVAQGKYTHKIITLIAENNKITRAEIAERLNVNQKTVERELKKMPNVTYIGSGYSGHWEMKE